MVRFLVWLLAVGCCFGLRPAAAVCPTMDFTGDCRVGLEDFAIFAAQWLDEGIPASPEALVWVSIYDPGVTGHEGFIGEISKYETTNAQFCGFLNIANASDQITVYNNNVYAMSDTNHAKPYYNLAGAGSTANGATNGGAARINYIYSSGLFTVDSGFEDHPVTYVSWYGATAFCNFYGYRLPNQWEWRAVADYNGSYTYGCGTTINSSIANYVNTIHPDGTTAAGAFGAYGYGMADMAGNVWEWTSSMYNMFNPILVGGAWSEVGFSCTVDSYAPAPANMMQYHSGFRVCRVAPPDMTWVFVNDDGFNGPISKYETTNAQYCKFLTAALASGDITVNEGEGRVYGAGGSNSGADFAGEYYYTLNGVGWTNYGATLGGSARIHYGNGYFYIDSGFENHPVTFVSWYGATAFCSYYGLHLPTGAQWQAVANYDGSYNYGCGTTITNSIANYQDSIHPNGTTAAGAFGVYGYGLTDMAGNVNEWVSDVPYDTTMRVLLGGAWNSTASGCSIYGWSFQGVDYTGPHIGFRAIY